MRPLGALPPVVATDPSSSAERNLLRGRDFGLPSGEAVAAALGEPVRDVVIGKATDQDPKTPITGISEAFAGNAPLWAYVLSEAQVTSCANAPEGPKNSVPIRLGPVGGRIVAEVFAPMLLADPTSFATSNPQFTPEAEFMHDKAVRNRRADQRRPRVAAAAAAMLAAATKTLPSLLGLSL